MMDSTAIRQSFLSFFESRQHQQVASAPLVPQGDPTLMFTNAGMVQFKDSFLGLETRGYQRAVTSQKCLRVSGKHNDLENVGPSPRHHTFFEMLGNFSFGDYFKAEAIEAAWELVTGPWGLDPAHLFATVFEEDDEAEKLWKKISTLPAERILRCGAKDNFWAMGETGPCGPCSEIFVDREPGSPAVSWQAGSDSGRYLEIWNLVFMQFSRAEDGTMTPLPNPSIDTGAGLERVTAVLQSKASNYETDLFVPIMNAAAELAQVSTSRRADPSTTVSLRVISDHLRAIAFLLADGIVPGPEGRGYVLRRLLRRAVRHGMRLGFDQPFLFQLVPVLDSVMGSHYRELAETRDATTTTIEEEEQKYFTTRAMGAKRIQDAIDQARADGQEVLSGEALFRLYDTYGQELETVREIAEEEQLELDVPGFEAELNSRRSVSRSVTSELQRKLQGFREALGDPGKVEFVGYDPRPIDATVQRVAKSVDGTARAARVLTSGESGVVVVDRTTFYPQGGGQVGDRGRLLWDGGSASVVDTQKDSAGVITHFVDIENGRLEDGDVVRLEVDRDLRRATERNHTATHLLHAALRRILGPRVRQAGSLVAAERLRFDFTHNQPLTDQQVREVERQVNEWILDAATTNIGTSDYQTAIENGAMALFGEKYGDTVRTVEVPSVSLELCGGCHVTNSGEIGLFLIVAERGVASGVRRIEAISGTSSLDAVRTVRRRLTGIEEELGSVADRAPAEIRALKEKARSLEKELMTTRARLVEKADDHHEVNGLKFVAKEIKGAKAGELRNLADQLRDKLGSGVVVLACRDQQKVGLVVAVSKDLVGRFNAGRLIKALATQVGGGGGGRPDFAQAGGRHPEHLEAMLASVPELLASDSTAN